ncbi:hypothetical protein EWM64_g2096 [Hericium alpestre]|uniref:Uncharacterized protein n=1 Tax=Hericium alpestre TaxID=135208 RepID=A0A4Z0A6D2_9AGAM|nr:hypothetical protein EWM64_g2096 [Hericium alpestre]
MAEGIAAHRDELLSSLTPLALDLISPSALVAEELASEVDLVVICAALERVFRTFVRPSQFKTIPSTSQPDPAHEALLDLHPFAVSTGSKSPQMNSAECLSLDDLDQPMVCEISDTPSLFDDLQLCLDSGEDSSSDNWTLDPNDDLCWVPVLLSDSEEAPKSENSAARPDFMILSDDEDTEDTKMPNTATLYNDVPLDDDVFDLF